MDEQRTRIGYNQFGDIAPEARAALTALGKAVAATGLDPVISELVKLRASQINGCAFCVAYHTHVLRRHGYDQDRLDLLPAWHETQGHFTPSERAALNWCESLTRVADRGAPDAFYNALKAHFSETQIVGLSLSVAAINLWNRLGVAFRFDPADAP